MDLLQIILNCKDEEVDEIIDVCYTTGKCK